MRVICGGKLALVRIIRLQRSARTVKLRLKQWPTSLPKTSNFVSTLATNSSHLLNFYCLVPHYPDVYYDHFHPFFLLYRNISPLLVYMNIVSLLVINSIPLVVRSQGAVADPNSVNGKTSCQQAVSFCIIISKRVTQLVVWNALDLYGFVKLSCHGGKIVR